MDTQNGFKLSPPLDWTQGSKNGAAVIFKDPTYKFNSLGVTVTPVRVTSLKEFASVEDAADRLISFEKNKVRKRSIIIGFFFLLRLLDHVCVCVSLTLALLCFATGEYEGGHDQSPLREGFRGGLALLRL